MKSEQNQKKERVLREDIKAIFKKAHARAERIEPNRPAEFFGFLFHDVARVHALEAPDTLAPNIIRFLNIKWRETRYGDNEETGHA